MDPLIIGVSGVVIFVVLVLLGTWLGFAAATVGLVGILLIKGWEGMGGIAGFLPYASTASFEFSVIPLFIIMGYFAYYAGLSRDIFHAARQWFGHFPGGLAIASVFGCAAFGAVCGSSTAATVVMGKVAVPEMRRYNYDPSLATAAVASSGTMASMIPPSIVMVIYGVITQQSIARLLIAGYIPGFLEALLYTTMIYVRCRRQPMLGAALPPASWKDRLLSLKGIWSFLILAGVILGGIYFGVFTPTEAGGAGAVAALLLTVLLRKFTWAEFKESLLETAKTTAMIFIVLVGVLIFLRFLALSGVTRAFIAFTLGLPWPPLAIMGGIIFIYLILGMFVSATGMLMLTLPIIFPVVTGLGFDPIWFGVMAVRLCETAFITPPVAMNVYAVKAVAPDVPTDDIIRGTMPFLLMDVINLVLLIIFPQIATWLPNTMTK